MFFGNPALTIALTNSARMVAFRASARGQISATMPTAADKEARMRKASALRQAGWTEDDIDGELRRLFGFSPTTPGTEG